MSAKHEPNDATRQMVQLHVSTGTPRDHIARLVGISQPTLRKHYKDELDLGLSKANATIAGVLFNKAKAGDSAAATTTAGAATATRAKAGACAMAVVAPPVVVGA